jgi:ribonuclease VapC
LIVDTSALIAVLKLEVGHEALTEALLGGSGIIPAPVIVEFERVASLPGNMSNPDGVRLFDVCLRAGLTFVPLDVASAQAAAAANAMYGSGSGHRAKLNMLDLMVYGMAKTLDLAILCTGRDFRETDAKVHPASRVG